MRAFIGLFIVLVLLGCNANKQTAGNTQEPPPPGWVASRPLNSAYYTGIGVAPKTVGTNYQRTAKENALSDLASEIKVNVNSNSLLYTLETNAKFEQEFKESIRTRTDLNLEDFEIVDTWEDGNSYWVYYRLNKLAYAEKLQAKKNTAQQLALDFLAKAESARNNSSYAISVDYYLRGLQALENFWNEDNTVAYQGNTILLDNSLFTGLKDQLNQARIQFESPIELSFQNSFKTKADLLVTTSGGAPLESVPLAYDYFGTYGRHRGKVATNADGRATISVIEADKERGDNSIRVSVDTELMFEPFQTDKFMKKLTETMRGTDMQKAIIYKPPSVYLISKEENLGRSMDSEPIASAIITSLGRRGITFANSKTNADIILKLDADTKKSGTEQGFYTSVLTVNIEVTESISGESRYKVSKNNMKGVDLNFEKAGLKAYQSFTRNIESELIRTLVNDLF